jgi:hypothetical protein
LLAILRHFLCLGAREAEAVGKDLLDFLVFAQARGIELENRTITAPVSATTPCAERIKTMTTLLLSKTG